MLDNLEALSALAAEGTMTLAARKLRLSQSAVSKRIAALEGELGTELVEPDGRRVRLSPAGRELVGRVAPLLAELRYAVGGTKAEAGGNLALGVSESVLASWGPRALSRVKRGFPELELAVHSHRSPVAVDRVRAGEYQVALVAGSTDDAGDLRSIPLGQEAMVIVPSGTPPKLRRGAQIPVLTIEPASGTWRAIKPALSAFAKARGVEINIVQTVESFACAVQMARAGFGHALAPAGIVRAFGIRGGDLIPLSRPGVFRTISLVGRSMTLSRPLAARFAEELQQAVARESDVTVPKAQLS